MNHRGHRVGAAALIGVLGTILLSCASAPPPKKEEAWPESTRTDWEHKDDPCKLKDGSPRECKSNEDCCKGFVCSLDPERSRIVRYCLEG